MAFPQPVLIRKRRPRRPPRRIPLWPFGIVLLVAAVAGMVWTVMSRLTRPSRQGLPGYLTDDRIIEREYARLYNHQLTDPLPREDFRYAAELAARADYPGAMAVLERITRKAAVPAIYNNLGVLYLRQNDVARAMHAFREAFARDGDYQPARANLLRMQPMLDAVGAVTREVEPNDYYLLANVISLDRPVDAEVSAIGDTDCFRFEAPPAPRDMLSLEIENLSPALIPALSVFDTSDRFLGWTKDARQPGRPLTQRIAPAPKTTLIVHVWGAYKTVGKYRFTIKPLKAFDRYEPNDDILNATRVPVGQPIDANIMDGADTDFYSFVAPQAGLVRVEIQNRSATLIPAVTIFSPDRRALAFAADTRAAGANLTRGFQAAPGQVYYVQVWPQAKTAGEYSMTIR
ncbi:MAG TPA: hypothetical protein VKV17_15780 [Bryobacteraceae bacterium]|nr:hypothetical protein [Bryobacteraceae bacterium]